MIRSAKKQYAPSLQLGVGGIFRLSLDTAHVNQAFITGREVKAKAKTAATNRMDQSSHLINIVMVYKNDIFSTYVT